VGGDTNDFIEHVKEVGATFADCVFEDIDPADFELIERFLEEFQALLEWLVVHGGDIKDLVSYAEFPGVRLVLGTHDGDAVLEAAACGEEFAVEGYL
jgi:hypothetical protein